MRSSRPSTAERRMDTEARSSVRQGTRRRSSSAKPAVAPKLRGLLATNEDSSADESRVRAGQSTKRSRPSIAEKRGASSSGRQGTRRGSSSAKPAVARKSRGSPEDSDGSGFEKPVKPDHGRQSRASSSRRKSGSRRIGGGSRERAKSSSAAAAPSRRSGEFEMFELDDEDEEATGSRSSSSHSKRRARSSGAIRRARFSSSQIPASSDDEGEEKQSPLSRKDLNFQGRSDEVADANDLELVSDVTDADFSDDDSYQPSVLSDDTTSDDEDELDWNPVPMKVNIRFNGVMLKTLTISC
mmetsp:Transcript_14910/g.34618  ORF Transcript_14910/g.34618 Transcript_14910/m.34618 type:complete len:298 (-) Transcript_14910:27-920(-)